MSSSFLNHFIIYLLLFLYSYYLFLAFLAPKYFGLEFYPFNENEQYVWPSPGYTYITSYFGYRGLPTAGATSYHAGIDIGAPEGSKFIAICDGTITFADFLGGGGYTITLTNENMKITYCHVSPNYIVKVGDYVLKGQVIGNVGPKNVYGVKRKSI